MDAFNIYTGVDKKDFALVWFGGTQNESNFNKKATRRRLEKVAVHEIAEEVKDKATVSSIRYAGTLLKGLSRVVSRKSAHLEKDCFAFNQQLKNMGTPPRKELDKTKKSNKQLFMTFDELLIDDIDVPDVTLLQDRNRASYAEITLREESDFLNPDEFRDMDPADIRPEEIAAGEEWLQILRGLDTWDEYREALAVGEEAPSLTPPIPAPGPDFELDPEQLDPADFEPDQVELAQSRVDPPKTSQASSNPELVAVEENQPDVNIAAAGENTIGTSRTTNEEENNNESVTEEKKRRKSKNKMEGLLIDKKISLLDASLDGLSRKGLEDDVSKLTIDQAPFQNFESISLSGGVRGRVLAANRKEIFNRLCSDKFLAEEINLNFKPVELARKAPTRDPFETNSSNRGALSAGLNSEVDAFSSVNVGASSLGNLTEGVHNITIDHASSIGPTKASTPFMPGVSVRTLPEVSLAPIVEDNPFQPPVELPVIDIPQLHDCIDLKEQIRDWLPTDNSWANFHDFCHENSMKRSKAALAFSALMVLLKQGVVDQKQDDSYCPIFVRLF